MALVAARSRSSSNHGPTSVVDAPDFVGILEVSGLVVVCVEGDFDKVFVGRARNEDNRPSQTRRLRSGVLILDLPAAVLCLWEVIVRLEEDIVKSTEIAVSVTHKDLLVCKLSERGTIAATSDHEGIVQRLCHIGGSLCDSEVCIVGVAIGFPNMRPIDVDISSSTARLAPLHDGGVFLNLVLQILRPYRGRIRFGWDNRRTITKCHVAEGVELLGQEASEFPAGFSSVASAVWYTCVINHLTTTWEGKAR